VPVAVYLRVSTEEQWERQSIATQREFAERYCALHQLPVFRVYADDGVSGTVAVEARPEGSQIVQDARNRKFDQLLIYKLDRLGRETRLILNAVAELEKLGVRVRSMTEEFDTGTSTGRLMLTLLSGFASHERDCIRERSVAGTTRVAEAGVWLGGIVPYGYRKVGEKRSAHLVISEEPIPGLDMSEADVIREVYRMAAVERKSCVAIAQRLNQLRVPCAYIRDDHLALRGKRKARTSGVWRPGRVRGIVTNKTYAGTHEYGKRTRTDRPVISRAVPAIVDAETWERAQANLRSHLLFSKRSAKSNYLLRGLIKCGKCGLTYIGFLARRPNGKVEFYYRCNGAHTPSIAWTRGKCDAKSVRGDLLEQQVWSDVETFLRNPEPVLQQLQEKLEADCNGTGQLQAHINRLDGLLQQKAAERNRVVGLYRRGRLTDAELDAQMDEIAKEERALEAQAAELRGKMARAASIGPSLRSAEALLARLRKRLDEPISSDQKRRIIEVLVAAIRVDTIDSEGVKQALTTVTYRFGQPDQAMPLMLPQSYGASSVIRIPSEPRTVGDHIRKRRLTLKLLQRDAAEQFGVDQTSIHNWEGNTSIPEVRYMPAIIRFLGYNPLPAADGYGARLVRQRTTLGLSQKQSAERLGVDPGTLARWERGERTPAGELLNRVVRFLGAEQVGRPASLKASE
jgi:site-specific DNA recombinase